MQTDYQDRPWDPNDPSTWTDPSGNPLADAPATPLPKQGADPAGAGLNQPVQTYGDGATDDSGITPPASDPMPQAPEAPPPAPPVPRSAPPEARARDTIAQPTAPPLPPAPPDVPQASVPPSQFNAQLRQYMMSQLGRLSGDVTADSPEVAPAIAAYNTQSQRDQQSERDAVAERFYAQGANGGAGLSSGGFDTALTAGREAAAANRANFTGNAVWTAAQSRRTELQGMLQMAVNAGETDAAQQIQLQIANLDASLRSRGLSQQNAQFGDQLGLSYAQLQAQMNRDAILNG